MIDTNIYSRQIVQFSVYDKCFDNEEDARKYANELEEYNKEYFSLDDPADALIKLIDNEIISHISNLYPKEYDYIYIIRKMILDRQPYDYEKYSLRLYISRLKPFQRLKVNTILYDLLNEYIKKYGSKGLPSLQSHVCD